MKTSQLSIPPWKDAWRSMRYMQIEIEQQQEEEIALVTSGLPTNSKYISQPWINKFLNILFVRILKKYVYFEMQIEMEQKKEIPWV